MLLATDLWLYNFLHDTPLYNEGQGLSDALTAPIDRVIDTVVRKGTSRYLETLQGRLDRPMLAIGLSDPFQSQFGYRLTPWVCADGAPEGMTRIAKPPTPIATQYSLEIRSPDELWLRRIEGELMRYFYPRRSIQVQAYPFGVDAGLKPVKTLFTLSEPRRILGSQGEVNVRHFICMFDLVVDQYLFGASKSIDGQPQSGQVQGLVNLYQSVSVTYKDLEDDVNLETQEHEA